LKSLPKDKRDDKKMINQSDKAYISNDIIQPYFFITGDLEYEDSLNILYGLGFNKLRLSDFCEDEDTSPNLDDLVSFIERKTNENNKYVVIGLGEYLAFLGKSVIYNVLSRFKDIQTNSNRIVLLLRGVEKVFNDIKRQDPTRIDNRRFSITDDTNCTISLALTPKNAAFSYIYGIKNYIKTCEDGFKGKIYLCTTIDYSNSIFPCNKIASIYEIVKMIIPSLNVSSKYGTDEKWTMFLNDLSNNENLLDMVYENRRLEDDVNILFDNYAYQDTSYINWLAFIKLKQNVALLKGYKKYIVDITERFEDFRKNVLHRILDLQNTDKRFNSFYNERKQMLKNFKSFEIIDFILENRKNVEKSIYNLTNITLPEKEEIIKLFPKTKKKEIIYNNYPELKLYLNKYTFQCGELSQAVSDYFEEYRYEKINNKIEDKMLKLVNEYAKTKIYSRLASRNEIIAKYHNKDNYLYWLDALGIEYTAYISALAEKYGLSITIEVGRSDLPSITSINKTFFEDWRFNKNEPNGDKRLDVIKHKDNERYDFTKIEEPIHLSKELDIIRDIIEKAAFGLYGQKYKTFILTSDHGASRLAVINKEEEIYEMASKGEHSGRCCKKSEKETLPNTIEENGYLVLTNYGRFKGSRKANIELHGGATLEEVLVPVIVLSLKDSSIKVELIDKPITASYKKCADFTIFSKNKLVNVTVKINDNTYMGRPNGDNHWTFILSDINKAGSYTAEILEGESSIAILNLNVQNEGGKKNTDFEDLF
jgi:hypothetical protein